MLAALTLLVACQLAGEVVARAIGLPIPGPVVGLVILLVALIVQGGRGRPVAAGLRDTANGLLRNLGLLFVPAGVGVVTQLEPLARNWVSIGIALLVSTFLGLVVTGWVMQRLAGPDEPAGRGP